MVKFGECKYLEMKKEQIWEQLLVSAIMVNTFSQGQKKEITLLANISMSCILKSYPLTCVPNFIDFLYEVW